MPIEDLPQRLRELGRLRMGEKAISKNGKPYPVKRSTWRLTSQSFQMLEALSGQYGGAVEPWADAPGEGESWQLKTDATSVDVLIPVDVALSQWYEFWTADGCTRRCTGKVNVIDETPCACPSKVAERMEAASGLKPTACKPTTRLNVMLPNTPDLGYWRLECHGYQAAIELPGALAQYVGLVKMYAQGELTDLIFPAELAIEERSSKKPGQPVSHYVVPVIRTPQVTPNMLMTGEVPGLASVPAAQIDAGDSHPPALETGSQRSGPPPAAPPVPFDESNELIVDRDEALAIKAEAMGAGLTAADVARVVGEVTGGSTNVITKVLKAQIKQVEDALVAAAHSAAVPA